LKDRGILLKFGAINLILSQHFLPFIFSKFDNMVIFVIKGQALVFLKDEWWQVFFKKLILLLVVSRKVFGCFGEMKEKGDECC